MRLPRHFVPRNDGAGNNSNPPPPPLYEGGDWFLPFFLTVKTVSRLEDFVKQNQC
jgi:hypothetical protein